MTVYDVIECLNYERVAIVKASCYTRVKLPSRLDIKATHVLRVNVNMTKLLAARADKQHKDELWKLLQSSKQR